MQKWDYNTETVHRVNKIKNIKYNYVLYNLRIMTGNQDEKLLLGFKYYPMAYY